jgi:two-component system, chemotaxis family, protein-glutamate methylesterase/glutaminase
LQVIILVAEDDPVTASLLHALLGRSAHSVVVVGNGVEAMEQLRKQPFKLVLSDWMMPAMDGIELLRKVRAEIRPVPVMLMMSSITNPEARQYALRSGADGFLAKPVVQMELLDLIRSTQSRTLHEAEPTATGSRDPWNPGGPAPSAGIGLTAAAPAGPLGPAIIPGGVNWNAPPAVRRQPSWMRKSPAAPTPSFPAMALCASTGGPESMRSLFAAFTTRGDIAGFVVIHGPDWMQRQCAELFQRENKSLTFVVAEDGCIARPGYVYIAPGDRHLVVDPGTLTLGLLDTPLVNFVRPAADPLFESIAAAFGSFAIGVVLTGLGSDGAAGASAIAMAGGKVLIEDPGTAIAPQMPKAALAAVGAQATVAPLATLAGLLSQSVQAVTEQCRRAQR